VRSVPSPCSDAVVARLAHQILEHQEKLRQEIYKADPRKTGYMALNKLREVLRKIFPELDDSWLSHMPICSDPTTRGQVEVRRFIEGILRQGGYRGRFCTFRPDTGRWSSNAEKPQHNHDHGTGECPSWCSDKSKKSRKEHTENRSPCMKDKASPRTMQRPASAPQDRTDNVGPRSYGMDHLVARGDGGHAGVGTYPWVSTSKVMRSTHGPNSAIAFDQALVRSSIRRNYIDSSLN